MPAMDPLLQHPLPHHYQNGYQQPPQQLLQPPHQQQPPQQQPPQQPTTTRRKKRGKRGSGLERQQRGLEARQRSFKRPTQQLGFFGQVPSLDDLRQENWRRTQQHYGGGGGGGGGGGPPRSFQQPSAQQQQQHHPHGSGRPGSYRRARKASKQPKFPQPLPRPVTLTPAAGNPLDTPANVGKAAAEPAGGDKLEVEGLQAGLDWYGTNENTGAALFLTGQQLTTSDSEDLLPGEEEELGSDGDGEPAAHSDGGAGGGFDGGFGAGGEPVDDAHLPRTVRARLVEQEAYIAELEDQNLRLREQLEMLQQEMDELRGQRHGGGMADSEEGFAEHSEGSLPGDLSVMMHPQQQQQSSALHHHHP